MSGDGDPAMDALGGPSAGSEYQNDHEQEQREPVEGNRHPLDQPDGRATQREGGGQGNREPDALHPPRVLDGPKLVIRLAS